MARAHDKEMHSRQQTFLKKRQLQVQVAPHHTLVLDLVDKDAQLREP